MATATEHQAQHTPLGRSTDAVCSDAGSFTSTDSSGAKPASSVAEVGLSQPEGPAGAQPDQPQLDAVPEGKKSELQSEEPAAAKPDQTQLGDVLGGKKSELRSEEPAAATLDQAQLGDVPAANESQPQLEELPKHSKDPVASTHAPPLKVRNAAVMTTTLLLPLLCLLPLCLLPTQIQMWQQ